WHTDFVLEERVIWIEIEGVPCKWWSKNTFTRIASRWGHLLNAEELEEGGYHSNRMCIYSKINTAICESFKMAYHGKIYWVRAIEVPGWVPDFEEDCDSDEESIEDTLPNEGIGENITKHNDLDDLSDDEVVPDTCFEGKFANNNNHVNSGTCSNNKSQDPFGIYELLNGKKKSTEKEGEVFSDPTHPPGFTPKENYANLSGSSNVEGEDNAVENEQKDAKEEGEYVEHTDKNNNDGYTDANISTCSGHFRKSTGLRTGGSMIQMMEDIVQVGLTMGYDMSGCLNQKAKQEWVKKLCTTNKVNFVSLQETKMENIDLWCIKRCWGNVAFDYVYSEAIGQSGGILSIWDPNVFQKSNHTISDYFTLVRGVWVSSGRSLLIISIYAPQELSEKKILWEYLCSTLANWDGDTVIMGDFNEVRDSCERFGSVFHKQGAKVFNDFIAKSGLFDVPLGGCSFTWCHKSASKMSKLDRFLVSESLIHKQPKRKTLGDFQQLKPEG
ncbi:RNA-directed DNA polymerase, eukaryota, partial [Tanacetum coccineum]